MTVEQQSVRDLVRQRPDIARWSDGAQDWTRVEILGSTDSDWDRPAAWLHGADAAIVLVGHGYLATVPILRASRSDREGRSTYVVASGNEGGVNWAVSRDLDSTRGFDAWVAGEFCGAEPTRWQAVDSARSAALARAAGPDADPDPVDLCGECDGRGYALFGVDRHPDLEIERCDSCGRLPDDDTARLEWVSDFEEEAPYAVRIAVDLIPTRGAFGVAVEALSDILHARESVLLPEHRAAAVDALAAADLRAPTTPAGEEVDS